MHVKKILSLIICLAITAGMFIVPPTVQAEGETWDGIAADYTWYDGQSSPYTISTAAQFAAFGNILNKEDGHDDRFAGKTIQLAADLDLGGKPFRAMGGFKQSESFLGTFEGGGHIISNLNITKAGLSSDYVALFSGLSNGAAIRNLGLAGVTMDVSSSIKQAAFVGRIYADTSPVVIENCFVRDVNIKLTMPSIENKENGGRAGGFVAEIQAAPTGTCIKNCYAVNVQFSLKEGDGSLRWGMGHFAGLTDAGAFINCYSGGDIEGDPNGLNKLNSTLSFGILKKTVENTNCYSDCYVSDSNFTWQFNSDYKRGDSKVATADLKGMTGNVTNLGDEFVKAESDFYNSGYPFLKWEEKYLEGSRQPQPDGSLTVESHEEAGDQQYTVTLNEMAGAEYRYVAYGKPGAWQDSNIFTNLPSGKYIFEARMPGDETHYPSNAIATDEEITLGDLSVWNGVFADYSWYDGQFSPYTISTAAQFAAFGNILNKQDGRDDRFKGKTIQLSADLDMNCKPFRAMGGTGVDDAFWGTFEGGGHIISNLNITQAGLSSDYVALFACIRNDGNGGAVRNLGLEGVTMDVSNATNQAAFAGRILGGSPITIENCFVRDVTINLTLPIENGRVGGFVAEVTQWPAGNCVKNCYAVNVRFSRKEGTTGDVSFGMGHFAGLTEAGAFINCYSGGDTEKPADSMLPNKVKSFGILANGVTNTNCYSDCYAADSDFADSFANGYKRGGTKVSTDDLKTMTGDVTLEGYNWVPGIHYNYGYPVLDWEIPTVHLAESGSDANNGTSGNPVKTLEKALALVPRIGIIEVEGTVDVSESLTLENKIVFFNGSGKLNKIGSGRISGNGIVDFGNFTGDVTSLNVFDGLEDVYGLWTIKTTGNYRVYLAAYSENRLEKVWSAAGSESEPVDVTAAGASLAAMGTTVYVWDDNLQPIIRKYTLGEKAQ